ncbi:MAG: hypothetical protein JWO48_988 [Bryobacterales bacterium]|nr:hypothetical protein [Bryobacterales bacterium]
MPAYLQILGVYRLDVTPEVFAEQLPMYGDEEQCRDHFSSVVLVEALVEAGGERFSLHDITQPNPAYPHGSSQAPWDEGLLSPDGETLLSRKISCVKGSGPLRFAFYMHYWDPNLPLKWTHGEVVCPQPQTMPVRLELLMPYRPCD